MENKMENTLGEIRIDKQSDGQFNLSIQSSKFTTFAAHGYSTQPGINNDVVFFDLSLNDIDELIYQLQDKKHAIKKAMLDGKMS